MESMIHDMAERLLRDHVTHRLRAAAASGQRPEALWTRIEEAGLAMALVPEAAGGSAYPPPRRSGSCASPVRMACPCHWLKP